ncbi:uncharacterized protein [Rutidosis leptorrhynchoides]|uniref:uncharacterized protein n=1 Tax=Rutidosis leptorrhynchoides TaxID=125765 RepID=UPI003A9A6653
MEHDQQVSKLPPLSSKYPWFIVQNLKDKHGIKTEFLSTLHDPLIKYECQIPEFYGRCILGYFHGWFIISDYTHNVMWFLWNPVTSKIVCLPPLSFKDGDGASFDECLLTAPPDDPTSVLLLKRSDESTFVFCQINCKRIRMMKWTEISYAKQLKKITSDGELLHSLTCCNGKIYALNSDSFIGPIVVRVEIVAKNRRVKIQLLMFGGFPSFDPDRCLVRKAFIKGYNTELFCVSVGVDEKTKEIGDVYLFRLDTSIIKWEELECKLKKWDLNSKIVEKVEDDDLRDLQITRVMWEEINELNDAVFYVDLGRDRSIFYNPVVASELRGYIQIRDETDDMFYLYHVEDRTVIASPMPSHVVSTTHVMMWEGGLEEDDHVDVVTSVAVIEVEQNGSCLYKIPFEVLEMIMKLCVGLEYLNFRATCKLCHHAAHL